MTTVPDWELHRRDLRPLAQQLSSLRHFLAAYASLSPVTRRKARLATGLPATALAGLDFRHLDPFEKFHPLTGIPLPQALLGAMNFLSSAGPRGGAYSSGISVMLRLTNIKW